MNGVIHGGMKDEQSFRVRCSIRLSRTLTWANSGVGFRTGEWCMA